MPSGPTIFLLIGYMSAWLHADKVLTILSQLMVSLPRYPQTNGHKKTSTNRPKETTKS